MYSTALELRIKSEVNTCSSYSRPSVFFRKPYTWTLLQYLRAKLLKRAFCVPKQTSTQGHSTKTTTVKLSDNYPSKTVTRTLPREYDAHGKVLIHGPPSHTATAILKCALESPLLIEVLRILKQR